MPNVMSAVAQAVQARSVWSRLGIVASVFILAIAAVTLSRLLREIELQKIVVELQAKSPQTLLIAGGFVVVAYIALTFYDFFALRTIGRREPPYRIAALASFTGYTIGHNLGATVFTAGVIRLRVYSAWGLNLIDIGKIAFVTGLTPSGSAMHLCLGWG